MMMMYWLSPGTWRYIMENITITRMTLMMGMLLMTVMMLQVAQRTAAKLAPRFESPDEMSDEEEILFDDIYEVIIMMMRRRWQQCWQHSEVIIHIWEENFKFSAFDEQYKAPAILIVMKIQCNGDDDGVAFSTLPWDTRSPLSQLHYALLDVPIWSGMLLWNNANSPNAFTSISLPPNHFLFYTTSQKTANLDIGILP